MKISIYSIANNLTDTTTTNVESLQELSAIITKSRYSAAIFKNNYRNNENFIESSLMILDYDNYPNEPQLTLQEAIQRFAPYQHVIATTRSHQRAKKSGQKTMPAADRFRVILQLSRPITSKEEYTSTWYSVSNQFPGADQNCKDPARFFYESLEIRSINESGALIDPVAPKPKPALVPGAVLLPPGEKGELSFKTQQFLKVGAEPGHWNSRLYLAARDAHEQLYSEEEFTELAEKITGYLDSVDLATIASAYSKDPKYSPRVRQKEMPAAERWARTWLEDNQVRVSYKTGVITFKGEDEKPAYVISRMVLDAKLWAETNPIIDEKGKEKPRAPYAETLLEHVYSIWHMEQLKETVREYRELLAFDRGANNESICQWVEVVTGERDSLNIAIMKHFVWQVKRKLFGLQVDWHIMPIFYGKTGSGKTRQIVDFLAPLNELMTAPQNMSMLDDTREGFVFGQYYVVFFDEMARAERVNVEALKNKITSNNISYRTLGTNRLATEKNVATFIGASNKEVREIIFDTTSARRFWQLNTLDRIDYSKLKDFNFLELWRSIDETADSPIVEHLSAIQEIQEETLRNKSYIEQWINEEMEITAEPQPTVSAVHLYDQFLDWADKQRVKSLPIREVFGRELSRLRVPKIRKNKGTFYHLDKKKKTDDVPIMGNSGSKKVGNA